MEQKSKKNNRYKITQYGTLKTWRYPNKVLDNIDAIKALTGDTTAMGVITHAVAAYLYGLTQHIKDVEIITEDTLKDTAIINAIPTPVTDADFWRGVAGGK